MVDSLLEGKTLVWISVDPTGLFTAATRKMLQDYLKQQASAAIVKLQLMQAESAEEAVSMVGRQTTGLISFVVPTVAQLAPTSQALWRMRGRQGQPITACFIDPDQVQHVPLLLESGAQIIVSQLDVWQKSLPRIVLQAPLSKWGVHPLTSGLVDRLPWPNT